MLKSYKYRVYPNEEQKILISKMFGCSRFVYNWGLDKKIKAYETDKTKLTCFDLANQLPELKKHNPWLKEASGQALQMSLRNLDNAFTAFFKKNSRFPKFKSKHSDRQSCQFPQYVKVDFEKNMIVFPKIGETQVIFDRQFDGKIKTTTLRKTLTNKYFVSVLVDDGLELPPKFPITEDLMVGIDVGIKHFATLSTGEKVENPKFLKKSQTRLGILQRKLSKKSKTSMNRKEIKLKVAIHHERIANQRSDFLHKLTHKLVCENQATMFVCEDLNVDGMLKNHCLAKSISDVSWSKFFELMNYKCEWAGKTFTRIGRFDPSSKICHVCGQINHNLQLKDREWTCESCQTHHDRDLNAAINIKKFGFIRSQGTEIESKQSPLERSVPEAGAMKEGSHTVNSV